MPFLWEKCFWKKLLDGKPTIGETVNQCSYQLLTCNEDNYKCDAAIFYGPLTWYFAIDILSSVTEWKRTNTTNTNVSRQHT
jgi:hypothetical protein